MNNCRYLVPLVLGGLSLLSPAAYSEDVTGAEELLCAPHTIRLCFEHGECFPALPTDIGMPEFIIVDTGKRELRTTDSAPTSGSSAFSSYQREGGLITLQGVENERAFSFIIHESTGLLTASVARDGFAVSAFGSCTEE